jgi:hypothetical protein
MRTESDRVIRGLIASAGACVVRAGEDSLSDLKFVSWKEIVTKALDETDAERLARLVPEAELAMFKRRQELDASAWNSEELSTMAVASEALRVVKRRMMTAVVYGPARSGEARTGDAVRRSKSA